MFRRLNFAAILSCGLFAFGACERHDWEKTKALHESHGHGDHEGHGDGGAKHEKHAPEHGEKAHKDEHKAPEKGGEHSDSGKKESHLRHVGL